MRRYGASGCIAACHGDDPELQLGALPIPGPHPGFGPAGQSSTTSWAPQARAPAPKALGHRHDFTQQRTTELMHVIHTVGTLDPRVGGPAVSALNCALAVAQAGVRVTLMAGYHPGDRRSRWWQAAEARCSACEVKFIGLPISRSAVSRLMYYPSPTFPAEFIKHLGTADIVHANSPWTATGIQASVGAKIAVRRLVLTPHEVFTRFDIERGGPGKSLTKRILKRFLASLADVVLFASDLERDTSMGDGVDEAKARVIMHPLAEGDFRVRPAGDRSHRTRLGYLGRLHPKKGIEVLIDALALLPAEVTLDIAGRGAESFEGHLHRYALARRVDQRIRWRGFITNGQKDEFFSNVDLTVMPSDFECFGVAAAEALARYLPVVVTPSTGIASLITSFGAGAVVRQDPVDLASAMSWLLTNDDAWESAVTGAGRAALELSPARHAEQLLHLYSQIVGASRR